ncbi:MAG: hypothetical protein A3G32_00300 [Deltaproteobacteria bacterium RIFCSPLOWO2_12_FULL_40_28]|nr:MAG: hypothetical protein A3C45_03455 [Deltaproteobacteria bacterium RIFCSPHIGHO2_02_FULL_40_28]OGQ19164.1 MAG: hypothetical protein A3E27_02340 [Deltaproteobacteria bacterium RIFCSPHIGHO2_12_FULL_40_32]OGQ39780.1 MAG: hypothetical protein A3I69_07415 [Deltaproteobacteria bacterium RIFCSPLOWO2_02_FULL_40_36]OGQ53616.1 MAG: hypothetical protein A3G32_00300 [Deltaproteobacteria bacterium RIFCSPLOWO2_12_FULL_40_28]
MLSKPHITQVLEEALSTGGDWSDLFMEETKRHTAELSENTIKSVAHNENTGAGVRVVKDGKEFYAYTNDLSREGLGKIAREVASAVSNKGPGKKVALDTSQVQRSNAQQSPERVTPKGGLQTHEVGIALLRKANEVARLVSPEIVQVNASYLDEVQNVLVANSDGMIKNDTRTRGRFYVTSIAGCGQEKQVGTESPGASKGFDFFESLDVDACAKNSAESALRMLTAGPSPRGRMTVIIDSGFGGVIFHEACGHLLEASAVAKKSTVFAESMGQVIASSCVSAVDDGTLKSEWGSQTMDDEGFPTQRNLLIENGVLKSFLVDRLNGERLGLKVTGSSRRQSYRFSPTSRMNNTFILPGTSSLTQMITETDYGLYAKKLGGGSVNPATGEFNFAVTEGYMIRKGLIAEPVRGAVLIGRGEEILKKIDRVGSELKLAQGLCGAASGWVPVDVGQPPIRVQDLLVGGR